MHHYGRSRSPKKERAAQRRWDWSFAHALPHRQLMRMRAHAAANEKPRTPPPRARFLNCGSGSREERVSVSFDYHFSQFRGALVSYKFPICSFVSCFYYLRSFVRSLSSIHFTRLFWSCFVLLCAVWPSDQGPSTARSAVDSP